MDKAAIVTCGSRGLGAAIVGELAERGYHVVVAARDLRALAGAPR